MSIVVSILSDFVHSSSQVKCLAQAQTGSLLFMLYCFVSSQPVNDGYAMLMLLDLLNDGSCDQQKLSERFLQL